MRPSSTSNSRGASGNRDQRRWPLAGLVALVLLFGIDRWVFASEAFWTALVERVPGRSMHTAGTALARLALIQARAIPDEEDVSFVIGSSRAQYGYRPTDHEENPGRGRVFRLAQPQLYPYQVLALVDEFEVIRPTSVVLLISEFDTHRPVDLIPGAPGASLAALATLAAAVPTHVLIDQRLGFNRLALDSILNGYRYRRVLGLAGADALRRFAHGEVATDRASGDRVRLMGPGPKLQLAKPAVATLTQKLGQGNVKRGYRIYFKTRQLVDVVTRGEHAQVQMLLLERAVERMTQAGIAVAIVETPLNPLAHALYDTSVRDDFLDFVDGLRRDYGIRFEALDPERPYGEAEFRDFVHLAGPGQARFSREVDAVIAELNARRAEANRRE